MKILIRRLLMSLSCGVVNRTFPLHSLLTFCCLIVLMSFQKKVNFEPTTSYLLKNLKPFSTYTFQLAAKSKHGIGAYTNEVSINTPQTRRSTHKYRRG